MFTTTTKGSSRDSQRRQSGRCDFSNRTPEKCPEKPRWKKQVPVGHLDEDGAWIVECDPKTEAELDELFRETLGENWEEEMGGVWAY